MTRVLVIDDDENIQFFVKQVLESEGLAVATAAGAQEGLALDEAEPFDLVITDIVMPEQMGVEPILKFEDRETTKTIAISSHETYLDIVEELVDAILPKPLKPETLIKTVKSVLDI